MASIQLRHFMVRASGDAGGEEELNRFLRGQQVLEVRQEFVPDGANSAWCIAVRYAEAGGADSRTAGAKRPRVDYREELEPEVFARFVELRKRRKTIAEEEALPAFATRLDANLADLRERLMEGACRFDHYERFTVYDPKERVISVAPFRDRVLHHALMNVCDLVLWGESSRELLAWDASMRHFCCERLGLELKPPVVNRSSAGLPFLGFVVLPGRLLLSSRSRRRARRGLQSCEAALVQGRTDQAAAGATARGILARRDWSTGAPLRRKLLAKCNAVHVREPESPRRSAPPTFPEPKVNRIVAKSGHCPRAGTASSAAAVGTATPGTAAAPTATGTSRAIGTTTSASASFSPPAQGSGRMSSVEPGSAPAPRDFAGPRGEVPSGGRVLVAWVDARDEGSRPPTFLAAKGAG